MDCHAVFSNPLAMTRYPPPSPLRKGGGIKTPPKVQAQISQNKPKSSLNPLFTNAPRFAKNKIYPSM